MNLYQHQREGVKFLVARSGAMLTLEMGLGKTRCALVAAQQLFAERKIDRVLVLAPATVRISWAEEISKLVSDIPFLPLVYRAKDSTVYGASRVVSGLPILIVSYALLPQQRHVKALAKWAASGKTLLVCDESSFLKNRTAKQTKGSAEIAASCDYRWLLTGTPIANSPLDLYGQALVLSPQNGNGHNYKPNGIGPLKGFGNFYHFQSRYAIVKMQQMGKLHFRQVVGYQNLDELTKRFAPYVLRRTKAECLDLPERSYTVREVALKDSTWRVYQELKRDALLALGDGEVTPEPNAAVRLLRLAQITSGHVGTIQVDGVLGEHAIDGVGSGNVRDVSSEKLDYLVEQIVDGELLNENALLIWTRWRRERERLHGMLAGKIDVYGIFGGQQAKNRSCEVQTFQSSDKRRVMIAQVHAGGYGLTLTAASTAVYISNSFSYIDRVQSADRIHRIGQNKHCLYIDVLACGPRGEKTVDHFILKTLQEKKSLADVTCSAWREALR